MKRHSVNSAARLADDLESALDLWSLATVGTQERHGVDAPVPANRHALRPVLTRHNFPPHYKNIRRDIRKESRRFRLYTPHPCRGGVAALGPLGTLATARRPGRGQKLETPPPAPPLEGRGERRDTPLPYDWRGERRDTPRPCRGGAGGGVRNFSTPTLDLWSLATARTP